MVETSALLRAQPKWRDVLVLLQIPFFTAMNLHLQNKLALVTGSTKGIGHAIAVALAAEGARVIVNGRTEASVADAIN
ncbi:SDR family NAD(P)-dependent oxidoreductase, partial [Vibrio astriarenae]